MTDKGSNLTDKGNDSTPDTGLNPVLPGGLIPLTEWSLPAASVQHTLKDALRTAWGRVQESLQPSDDDFRVDEGIASLSPYQLRRFAPDPDWELRSQSLGIALDERVEQARDATLALVAPPHSGLHRPLLALAEKRQWTIIHPPESLLLSEHEAAEWWQRQPMAGPWLITELGHFWLRHRSGLALLKAFFVALADGRFGPGVVGCSSWCWSFWQRYLGSLPVAACTPAPLYEAELACWLTALPGYANARSLAVRTSNSGHWVLPPKQEGDDRSRKFSSLLKDLAALSRGNPGVALALWRKALRAKPDESLEQSTTQDAESSPWSGGRECWAVPLDQLPLPTLSPTAPRSATAILHALLLHDRLPEASLALVAGLSAAELAVQLRALCRSELVEQTESGWQVTACGYPAVRRQLQSTGYPVDGF